MIVVSASMKKAGSGWYFNMTNDLLVAAGHADVRALRERYALHDVLQGGNCQVNARTPRRTARIFLPLVRGHTFAVKTHGRPTHTARVLMRVGVLRATYIYRDPRDVVLSLLDHGRRLRDQGRAANVAADLHTVDDAARYVDELLGTWERWMRCPGVLTTRYEDLVADPEHEMGRLARFLGLRVGPEVTSAVVRRYAPDARSATDRHHLHFHRGVVRRFEKVMSRPELDRCTHRFAPYLVRMGYPA